MGTAGALAGLRPSLRREGAADGSEPSDEGNSPFRGISAGTEQPAGTRAMDGDLRENSVYNTIISLARQLMGEASPSLKAPQWLLTWGTGLGTEHEQAPGGCSAAVSPSGKGVGDSFGKSPLPAWILLATAGELGGARRNPP